MPIRQNLSHRPAPPMIRPTRTTPSPRPPGERKVALVVGRYGVGSAIAAELAKTMDVVITYGHDSGRAEKVVHQILARDDVPITNALKAVQFMPTLEVGCYGDASKKLVSDALGELSAKMLDVVVYASVYEEELPDKKDVFNMEVSAFYDLYQATKPYRNTGFRMIHVSTGKNPDANVTIEALLPVLGEELQGTATVNAIRYTPLEHNKHEHKVVGVVNHLLEPDSWFINGQVICRISPSNNFGFSLT